MSTERTSRLPRLIAALIAIFMTASVATACSSSSASGEASANSDSSANSEAAELRLGYFANLTHALPVLGVANGEYQKALGGTKLTTQVFNAGPAAVEAVLSGAVDAAYIGPNPAINAFSKSDGEAIRIVAGATSGGAQFVVKPEVTTDNLKGRTFATPQLGNTQDVALRYWLQQQGLTAPTAGGGDVNVQPMENSTTLTQFKAGDIDGAWLPEPWASRLVLEGGGKVLVDEASLWPNGEFVTTQLIVATPFLQKYPATVSKLLEGQLATQATVEKDPAAAQAATNAALEQLSGKALSPEVLARSWPSLKLTVDPIASSLRADQEHAVSVGLAKPVDLAGIDDLRLLKEPLVMAGTGQLQAYGATESAPQPDPLRAAVTVSHLTKVFDPGAPPVLLDVDLVVGEGEFVCLLGASGCGKSTLLNILAGLDQPTSGTATVEGTRVALMFQESALFPWLTAAGNIDLALRLAGVPRRERPDRVEDLLGRVHLGGQGGKRVHELSGGMRQRVALARALAQDAHVLLMDEPFAALDAITRDVLHEELTGIWRQTGLTVVFVTHNVREAVRLGQRVLLMSSRPGRIVAEWRVELDEPRAMDTPEVAELASTITANLRQEIRRHAR